MSKKTKGTKCLKKLKVQMSKKLKVKMSKNDERYKMLKNN